MDEDNTAWVSSLGNYSYEMVCALAAGRKRPLIVVLDDLLPEMRDDEKRTAFYREYGDLFPPERTLLLSPLTPGRLPPSRERQQLRDACVVGLADHLLAAEVRPGGNMERLAIQAGKNGRPVTVFRPAAFDLETAGNKKILAEGADAWEMPRSSGSRIDTTSKSSSSPKDIVDPPNLDGQFLIHFTRSCPGPWPGQGLLDYYQSLIREEPGAHHTAFDTLVRILTERRIRAQSHMIRGKTRVVSFTAAGMLSARYLIQWRKGLVRWTFEPYGLAVDRRVLLDRGVRPVIYGGESVWRRLSRQERYRFQKYSSRGGDWIKEKEWRMAGDLDMNGISNDNIRVIVRNSKEAAIIETEFDLPVVYFQRSE